MPALDDELEQRLVVILVQEEHLIGQAQCLDAHLRELVELGDDELRRPEAHVGRVGGHHALRVVHAVDDVDHAEVALELAAERGVERGERCAQVMVELRVPEVRAIQV